MTQHEQPEAGWRRFVAEANATGGLTPAPLSTVVTPTPLAGAFPSPPSFDVLELLPERAQDRLRLLRQRRADAHALIPEFEQIREASMAKIEAANALKRLIDHAQDGGFGLKPDDSCVIIATKVLDRATDDFKRRQAQQEQRSAAFQAAAAPATACDDFLRHALPGGTTLLDYDGPEPKLVKGENGLLDAVENRRRRVRELKADAHRIRSSPYPSSYCKAQMRAQIEHLSQRGEPSVSRCAEIDGQVEFETQHLRSTVRGGEQRTLAFAETPDALALISWLHRDTLIKRLDELIDAEADDKSALTHEQRQQREAETLGDPLDVERQEAALTWSAIEQGLPIEFRSDINPLAILQVRLVTTPPATELPPSSPERAGYNLIGGGR